MSVFIPGQEVERTLRDSPQRLVLLVRCQGILLVTRILRSSKVSSHHARLVQTAVTKGRGSFMALGEEIAMTLEGYQVAARLLPEAGTPPTWPQAVDGGVTAEGFVFVTTTWVEGHCLHQLPRALSVAERQKASLAILDLLVAMHEKNIAYGDLKLDNLVLRPDGGVSLIDLDTLREVPGPDAGAPSRDRTVSWAAPEQISQQETWLGSDLWALSRVLREIWGNELPVLWMGGLAACRAVDPVARPTALSLRNYLIFGGGTLVDHEGKIVSIDDIDERRPPSAAEETERVAGGSTERVAEGGVLQVSGAPAVSGSTSVLLRFGKVAMAVGVVVVIVAFSLKYVLKQAVLREADAHAEALLAEMKVHKTDPAKNGPAERSRLAEATAALWEGTRTPRTCAVRALSMTWDQRWHTDAPWSQADFDAASAAVSEPDCRTEPEAMLARATLYAGSCRRRDKTVVSTTDCQLSIEAVAPFWQAVPQGVGTHWLRVEAAWQELRARSALIGRYVEFGNPAWAVQASVGMARCAEAEAWLPFAPVNGPELLDECLVAAGGAKDVTNFFHFADLRFSSLPADTAKRQRVLSQVYAAAGPECAEVSVAWRGREGVVVSGHPWCAAMGHVARRCPAAAEIAEGARLGTAHPWRKLEDAMPARWGPCLD